MAIISRGEYTVTPVFDGLSDKFYRAWADSADGSQGFSTTDSSKEYFGVYAGTTPPANYKAYSWTKIKGESGRSVTNTEMEYAINDSKSTPPTTGWSLDIPVWKTGLYIWQRVKVSYSTGNPSYTTPHCIESNIIEDVTNNIGNWVFKDKTEVLSGTEIFTDKADEEALVHVGVDGKSYQSSLYLENQFTEKSVTGTTYATSTNIKISMINGHKYYTRRIFSGTGTGGSFGSIRVTTSPYFVLTSNGQYGNYSQITEFDGVSGEYNAMFYGYNSEASSGGTISDTFIIDLTKHFGSGNEPTKAEMDTLTDTSGWFSGGSDLSGISQALETKPSPDSPIETHSLNDFDVVSSSPKGNLLYNGDFSSGLSRWVGQSLTVLEVSDKTLKIRTTSVPSVNTRFYYDIVKMPVGSRYILSYSIMSPQGGVIRVGQGGQFIDQVFTSKPTWQRVSIPITSVHATNTLSFYPQTINVDFYIKDIILLEDTTESGYINKINLLLDEPLRSVGDVKDRLFRDTDGLWKVERYVGEYTTDGTDNWSPGASSGGWNVSGNTIPFYSSTLLNKMKPARSKNAITNRFTVGSATTSIVGNDREEFSLGYASWGVICRIRKDRLATENGVGFRDWLESNPVTIIYELANPTIETLPQSLQDKLNRLRSFKDSNYVYTLLPDKSNILSENLKPTLHATFKSIAWANDFRYKFEQSKAMHATDIWFAKGVSNTIAPSIGWSTDAPVWEDGLYIWSKTITTYGDGRTEETSPVCITGATGRSVDRIEEWYYLSNKPDVLEGGTWSNTPPNWTNGKYIWTKNKIIYKNPSGTDETAPINSTGGVGQKGDTGTDAKTARLANIIHAVHFDQDGLMPSVSSIAFPTAIQGFTGLTPYYEFKMGDTIVRGSSTASSWTLNTSAMKYSDFPITVTVNVSASGQILATDTVTIVGTKPGQDAYTVVLANESHTFVGDVSNAIAGSTTANVIAYRGGTQVGATIGAISGLPTGMSSAIYSNGTTSARVTFTVTTGMTSPNGVVNIPVTVNGKSFTKVFNYAIAFKGAKGDKGTDGLPGKDGVGIRTTVLAYASSTSGTTTPTSGWTTTVPTVAAGNYLWTRTTWTYTDNSSENGYTVSRIGKDGNTGSDGAPGKDGVGITSTAITYTSSTSGTVTPTSGWQTTVPNVAIGSFLWTRTIWTYTDGTNETGYSVGKMGDTGPTGARGPTGPQGVSITRVDVQYYLSTSNASLTGGSWSTIAPDWIDGRYMWSRTITTYSSGNPTESTPVCITGAKGSTGVTGRGVSSIAEQFYLSDSKTSQTGGSWSNTMPTWSPGKYIWTRSLITYTTGTPATSTTEPLVSSEWEAINELEIGGRNLLPSSYLSTRNNETSKEFTISGWAAPLVANEHLKNILVEGETYTLSYEAELTERTSAPTLFSYQAGFLLHSQTGSNVAFYSGVKAEGEKAKVSITFTCPTLDDNHRILYYTNRYTTNGSSPIGTDTITFTNLKLEKGNKATDWTPAPEDVDASIKAAQDKANAASQEAIAAQADATVGKNMADNLSNDSVITQVEKLELKREWDAIVKEKPSITIQATDYALQSSTEATAYNTAYTTLNNSIPSLLANMNVTSSVARSTFNTNFANYYDKRQLLLNRIAKKAKELADGAQSSVNNLEIGGVNLLKNSNFKNALVGWGVNGTVAALTVDGRSVARITNTTGGGFYAYPTKLVSGSIYTISFDARSVSDTSGLRVGFLNEATNRNQSFNFNTTWKRYSYTIADPIISETQYFHFYTPGATIGTGAYITNIQLEKGNKPTDWTPAPEDIEDAYTAVAQAKAEAERVKAEAYADDKVTTEEQARIADADTKLAAAKKYAEDQILADKKIKDTRNDNQNPSWYFTNYKQQTIKEFKYTSTIGVVSSEGTYGILETEIPWTDASGGPVKQTFRVNSKTFKRSGTSTSWSSWVSYDDIAETAKSDAATAISIADGAASSASTANSLLVDIASDSKLTATEKKAAKKEWDIIVGEKPKIDISADNYGITTQKTTYNTAYNTLNTYLSSLLANLNTTSNIVGTTFRANFKAYYDARQDLLNAIADGAKLLVDEIEVGGTNLIIRSEETINKLIDTSGLVSTNVNNSLAPDISVEVGKDYTFTKTDSGISENYFRYGWYKDDGTFISREANSTNVFTVKAPANASILKVSYPTVSKVKVEKGNKPTSWSPAPEDVQSQIDKSVKSTDVEYYLSTSSTALSGGSWQTTAPAWVDGRYMWSRTKVVLNDGTISYNPSPSGTNITGATGATGARGPQGAPGVSVQSITEYYLATSAATGVTTGTAGWTTTMQTMNTTNKYLWNYELIKFSDNSTQPTIPVIIGVHGATGGTGSTGATGRSITGITEHYLATSAVSGVTRSTSGWSTTMQGTTTTNKYLWNYETITWNSAPTTTYVEPIIIGVHGATGSTGAKGDKGNPGENATARNFLLDSKPSSIIHTSSYEMANFILAESPKSGETYSLVIKGELASGKQHFGIYNSNGSSPLGSTISLGNGFYVVTFNWVYATNTSVKIYAIPNSVVAASKIEWVTMVKGSVPLTEWVPAHEDIYKYVDDVEIGGTNLAGGSPSDWESKVMGVGTWLTDLTEPIPISSMGLKAGDTVTLSIELEAGSRPVSARIEFFKNNTERNAAYGNLIQNSTGVSSLTTTIPADRPDIIIRLQPDVAPVVTAYTIKYRRYKLEKGSKVTSWSPAPEDVAIDVNKKAYNPVRYIRDWSNGSTVNAGNHWYQLMAFDEYGNNVALSTTVSTNGTGTNLTHLVNGVVPGSYASATNEGNPVYVQVDLGKIYYNITEIKVWKYYNDGRTYYEGKTEVSINGSTWIPIYDSSVEGNYTPTANGKSIPNTIAKAHSLITGEGMTSIIDSKANANEIASALMDMQQEIEAAATAHELSQLVTRFNQEAEAREADKKASEGALQKAQASLDLIATEMGDRSESWNFLERSIRNTPEGIVIGNESTGSYVLIKEDKISFYSNGNEVAFIAQNLMEISRGTFVEEIQISKYKLEGETKNNHLTFRFVG